MIFYILHASAAVLIALALLMAWASGKLHEQKGSPYVAEAVALSLATVAFVLQVVA